MSVPNHTECARLARAVGMSEAAASPCSIVLLLIQGCDTERCKMYEVWKWSPSPRGGGGRVLGDLLTLLVSWVTQAIHWHMQHTHLNVHCALIQLWLCHRCWFT